MQRVAGQLLARWDRPDVELQVASFGVWRLHAGGAHKVACMNSQGVVVGKSLLEWRGAPRFRFQGNRMQLSLADGANMAQSLRYAIAQLLAMARLMAHVD